MFKCDYHTHTYFSFDGAKDSTPDSLCQAAIERGITDLAITDHFECNWRAEAAYPPYQADKAYEEIMAAKEKYKGKLNLTYGIEIGQANQYPEEAKTLLDSHGFDFIIGSIHNLKGAIDFYYWDFAALFRDMQHSYVGNMFERYIDELCEVVDTFDKIDTIAHLTYIYRYCALSGNHYDLLQHADAAEVLFKKMVARDIALEVNVSTLWKGLGFAMPDRDFLSLYKECGGRLVTVGTDSHSPEHIGECVSDGFELLRSVGLCDIVVIRNGKKETVKI
jgi:histidinol-phosphatase (PHP family)